MPSGRRGGRKFPVYIADLLNLKSAIYPRKYPCTVVLLLINKLLELFVIVLREEELATDTPSIYKVSSGVEAFLTIAT